MPTQIVYNHPAAVLSKHDSRAPLEFHRRLPGYTPTPLVEAPGLAASLGIGKLWIKNEALRLGLPAFKMLGASWACYLALQDRMGGAIDSWTTLDDLADRLAPLRPLTLVTATDGNHGRAVARIAAQLGFAAQIFVPAGMAAARIRAIESEGAQITIVDGTYDEAVALAAAQASPRCLVISDTAWPGYELIPQHVIAGYSTIFWEIDDELERRGEPQPDLIAVQIGVGALAAAVVRHYRRDHRRTANDQRTIQEQSSPVGRRLSIVGVEPTRAACMLESIRAGRMIEVPGPHDSIMAGLNCGAPSPVAWPSVSNGVDLFVAIEDTRAEEAMRLLAQYGVVAGETGAAGLGGLLELLTGQQAAETRAALSITPDTRALLISTEGATDPDAYARIVGQPADTSVL